MKKRNLFLIGIITALFLTGCQANTSDTENEALKQQITKLEQQVTALEQQTAETESSDPVAEDTVDSAAEETVPVQTVDSTTATTTHTLEELTALVEAYEEKAKAAAPTGAAAEDMEQFFTLKQEEDQINDALDLHEDELEKQYRNNTLTRDEYKKLERELENLEDRLDDAEDRLELTFGIDD